MGSLRRTTIQVLCNEYVGSKEEVAVNSNTMSWNYMQIFVSSVVKRAEYILSPQGDYVEHLLADGSTEKALVRLFEQQNGWVPIFTAEAKRMSSNLSNRVEILHTKHC